MTLLVLLVALAPIPLWAAQHSPAQQQPPAPTGGEAGVRLFFPIAAKSPPLTISRIEVTQAVQNTALSVPLVQNRPAAARITLQSSAGLSGLTVVVRATRGGVTLAGSPLRSAGVSAPVSPAPGSAQVTFLLPTSWLAGNIALSVEVFASGSSVAATKRTERLTFTSVPRLRVVVVPVRYIHAPSGQSYMPDTSNLRFPGSTLAMFPLPSLDLSLRGAIVFRGDLAADDGSTDGDAWGRLYSQISTLKSADGAAPATVYVGLLPAAAMQNHRFGIAGLGGSARVTVGFDLGLVLTHEMGHALGRGHAPCGSPITVDPAYPYAGGSIGAFGYNTRTGAIFDPAVTTDVMSYCEEWISDYTYVGLLNDQIAVASVPSAVAPAATSGSILVRAQIHPNGSATMLPTYSLSSPPNVVPASGPFSVAVFDTTGEMLGEWPVAVVAADEYDVAIRQIHAALPLPAAVPGRVELRKNDSVLAAREFESAETAEARPTPFAEVAAGELVIHNPAGVPLLARVLSNSGVTTLAVDLTEAEARFALDELPGGANLVELVESGQFHQPSAASQSRLDLPPLPNRPPQIQLEPTSGPAGSTVIIPALAWDLEDGSLSSIVWRINGAAAGEGPILHLELGSEPLEVEALVTDSEELTATAFATVRPILDEAP